MLKRIPGVQYYTWFRSAKIKRPLSFKINELKIKLIKFLKRYRYSNRNDNNLKKLKDIHLGESCVIIGNGPSLRIDDLELLKKSQIITFSCNRINKLFDKTSWRPDYYCLSDSTVFKDRYFNMSCEELLDDFMTENIKNIFLIENIKKYIPKKYSSAPNILFFRMSLLPPFSAKMSPFSTEISDSISDLGTVAATCIQIAVYMGFESIYLYGIDNNFQKYLGPDGEFHVDLEVKNYVEGIEDIAPKDKNEEIPKTEYQAAVRQGFVDLRKFDNGFSLCQDYAKFKKINIYNITRGGKLERFERKDFDDLFYND